MRSIGIPVADRPECVIALDVAFSLAQTLKADINGYHIVPNRRVSKSLDLQNLQPEAWPDITEVEAKAAAESARKLFESMADSYQYKVTSKHGTTNSPHAIFKDKSGSPEKLIPLFGPVNDMLVVSRPKSKGNNKAAIIMMSALLYTATPVMVLPQKKIKPKMKRIAIAWNNGRAEGILTRAMVPVLQAADEVVFITEGKDHQEGPSAKEMMDFLKAYGIKSRLKRITGKKTAESLVSTAKAEKADIMLCGAYSRGRTRQVLFGGVTQHLLTKTDFPVVLLHV